MSARPPRDEFCRNILSFVCLVGAEGKGRYARGGQGGKRTKNTRSCRSARASAPARTSALPVARARARKLSHKHGAIRARECCGLHSSSWTSGGGVLHIYNLNANAQTQADRVRVAHLNSNFSGCACDLQTALLRAFDAVASFAQKKSTVEGGGGSGVAGCWLFTCSVRARLRVCVCAFCQADTWANLCSSNLIELNEWCVCVYFITLLGHHFTICGANLHSCRRQYLCFVSFVCIESGIGMAGRRGGRVDLEQLSIRHCAPDFIGFCGLCTCFGACASRKMIPIED